MCSKRIIVRLCTLAVSSVDQIVMVIINGEEVPSTPAFDRFCSRLQLRKASCVAPP